MSLSIAALSAAGVVAVDAPAQAATFPVTTAGEFITAVTLANNSPVAGEADVIELNVPADETWVIPQLFIEEPLTIRPASGAGRVTFQTSDPWAFWVTTGTEFTVSGADITGATSGISSRGALTLTDVDITTNGFGIDAVDGRLTATDVSVTGAGGVGIRALDMLEVLLDTVTISDRAQGAEIRVASGTVTIRDSHLLRNGMAFSGIGGLSIDATASATVLLDNATISGNRAFNAAGLLIDRLNASTLTIVGSTISDNRATGYGGGIGGSQTMAPYSIDDSSTVVIEGTTIEGNRASDTGGGIALPAVQGGSTVTISRSTVRGNLAAIGAGVAVSFLHDALPPAFTMDASTVAGNTASQSVGGLLVECDDDAGVGTAVVTNSTISGNSADLLASAFAAGCPVDDGTRVRLENSTITANAGAADAAVAVVNVSAAIRNTVIGGNTNGVDLDAADASALSVDYSLVQRPDPATTTALNAGTANLPGVAPQLGALAANGGPTDTHLPTANGNLVDSGDPAFAPPPATDQRGEPRVVGILDIGAVEAGAYAPPSGSPASGGQLPATGTEPAMPLAAGLATLLAGLVLMLAAARTRRRA